MSAPVLWIFLPFAAALLLWPVRNQKLVTLIASLLALFLTLCAWLLPIDTVITLRGLSFKLAPSFEILGRNLTLAASDRALLALLYGSVTFWFVPAAVVNGPRRTIPLGLMITALLVASLAVEPFLYAALLLEVAVLLSIPLLAPPGEKPGKGLLRFLIFQTLAMPFILFSGWLLTGIEANPGDVGLVKQAAILLGMGFAILLSVFPFSSWIPVIMEEAHPYPAGFLLWMFPTATMIFGLGFLDRYSWLREAPTLSTVFVTVGILMVVTGGLLAIFQRRLERIFGFAVVIETGYSLLALSLGSKLGVNTFLILLVPRTLSLLVWTLSLSVLKDHFPRLAFADMQGAARKWPLASIALALSTLSLAGLPLLAGFPAHLAIWQGMARTSLTLTFWSMAGSFGLFIAAIRTLSVIVRAPEGTRWQVRESRPQIILFAAAWLTFILFGLFPQWGWQVWNLLPSIFTRLGQ